MLGLIGNYLEARHAAQLKRPALLAVRDRRLRRLLVHAFDRSAFYRDLYASHGLRRADLAEVPLASLPTVGKRDIRESFDTVVTVPDLSRAAIDDFLRWSREPGDLFRGRYRVMHTSGTTGEPAVYCYGPGDWDRGLALQSRLFNTLRLRRRVAVYGVSRAHAAGATLAASTQRGVLRLFYDTRLYDIAEPFEQTVDALNAFQPQALFAYGSALEELAVAQRSGMLRIEPRHIFAGAEPTPGAVRAMICETFPEARCFDFYSAGEAPAMGVGDLRSDRLLLMDDFYCFEPEPDGLLITNLFNLTQPLIRYRLGDPVRVVSEGAPFQVVESISARPREDVAVGATRVSSHVFDAMYVPGIRRYQYAVEGRQLQVRVVLDPDAAFNQVVRDILGYWRPILERLHLADVRVDVSPAAALEVDPRSGKLPLIVRAA